MTPRNRVLSFGAALLTIVIGGVTGALLGGVTGEAVAVGAISLGGIAVVSLIFLEIGLGEDRDRARELEQRQRAGIVRPRRPPARRRRP